jgi:hypothetical protein
MKGYRAKDADGAKKIKGMITLFHLFFSFSGAKLQRIPFLQSFVCGFLSNWHVGKRNFFRKTAECLLRKRTRGARREKNVCL